MRKRVVLIIVLLIITTVPLYAFAHPGSTDSDGGHTDSETGDYHYHHGYPAHEHRDMDGDGVPDCPYNFDDKTGWNSGTRSGGVISGSGASRGLNRLALNSFGKVLFWLCLALIVTVIILLIVIKERRLEYEHKINSIKSQGESTIKSIEKRNKEIAKILCAKDLLVLAEAPEGDEINNGLPVGGLFGQKYTVYISQRGARYHIKRGCSGANIQANIYDEAKTKTPCFMCASLYKPPDTTWVDKYKKLSKFFEKYKD